MTTKLFGEGIRRQEDPRLLRGQGMYVDDVKVHGTLEMATVRSPYAHAKIKSINTEKAKALPGVVAVYTAADLGKLNGPLPLLIPNPALHNPRTHFALAPSQVNYAGENVAAVIAVDRYVAEDACELIEVEYEPLPVVVDLEAAAQPGSPTVHPDLAHNIAGVLEQNVGDVDAAFAKAAFVIKERLTVDRGSANPMETRAMLAVPQGGQYLYYVSTQAPVSLRALLARWFDIPEHKLRVVAPDVGGGFGPKVMMGYPEEILTLFACMQLNQPVKWVEDRREHFVATTQERTQIHDVEAAFDENGILLGIKDHFYHDSGAYCPYGVIVAIVSSTTLPGPYRLQNYHTVGKVVFTNKPIVSPYRGAGRPHGVFVMERVMDRAAEHLSMDKTEVRRRNLIQNDEFPWDTGLIYQDGAPTRYDSGNFPEMLERLRKQIDWAGFPARKAAAKVQGKYRGIGLALYVEGAGPGPYEGCRVRVEPSGKVMVATGVGTQGQSHFTTFAQVVADELGCSMSDMTVVTGDTAELGWGIGTFASRGAVTAGNAAYLAAKAVAAKTREVAARMLECSPDDVVLAGGKVHVKGAPSRSFQLGEVAAAANPLRGTLPPGFEPGLEATKYFTPTQSTFPSGGHAVEVEVDPETGFMEILKYCVIHDCGHVINPMVVDGQVHGGVVQGLGGVFYEKLVFDDAGQLLTSTYMDYLLPTATEVPHMDVQHMETPSPLNPLGVKGAGEAGVIPGPAVFAQAFENALEEFGVRINFMPLNPSLLRQMIAEGQANR